MEKNDVNYIRLIKQLRHMVKSFEGEAHCFGYRDDPDYLAIKKYLEEQIERIEGGVYVKYQWSEDGVIETMKKEDILLVEAVLCDYCDTPIDAGRQAVKLTATDGDEYILHPHCAKKSCF